MRQKPVAATGDGAPSPLERVAGSLSGLLLTRLEIIGIELTQEKQRLLSVLLLAIAAMVFGTLALAMVSALVLAICWDNYRWQALLVLAVVYIGATWWCIACARRGVLNAPATFETTLDEFRKDREMLRDTR